MELSLKNKADIFLDQAIKVGLIIFVIGSPFSISLAQIGLVPAILFWLIQIILNKFNGIKGSFIDLPIIIFLIGQLITSIFCKYSGNAFASYQGEWQILLVYLIVSKVDVNFLKKLLKIMFFVCVLISIYGIYQHFSGWDIIRQRALKTSTYHFNVYDITGGFGLHLTFGGYYMMIVLLGAAYFLRMIKNRWFYISGTILIILATIGSYARSAWIGLLAGALILFVLTIKNKKKLILTVLCLFIFLFGLAWAVPGVKYRISTLKDLKNTRRPQIWRVALLMIKDHPFIGVGNGNFKKYYEKYRIKKKLRPDAPEDKVIGHPHNDLLSIYLTAGLLGFIGYLLMWFRIIKNGIKYIRENREEKYLMAGLVSGVIAFFIAGLGQNYFTDSENSMLLWFFIGSILSLYNKNTEKSFPLLK